VSNVDLAATIFDLVEAEVPENYTMDGSSWLDDVVAEVEGSWSTGSCCQYRHIDIKNSRSIVTPYYQYIWRANDDVESADNVDALYPSTYDHQQLYDLNADPDQKINLIADYESYRDSDSDGSLSTEITTMQTMMRQYVEETCPAADGVCDEPPLTFCDEVMENYYFFRILDLDDETTDEILDGAVTQFAAEHPDCAIQEFWYNMTMSATLQSTTYKKVEMSMDVCCGEDGAIWPGDYEQDGDYTLFVVSDTDTDSDSDSASSSVAVPAEWPSLTVFDVKNPWTVMLVVALLATVFVSGCAAGGRLAAFKMRGGVKMMKLQGADSDESDEELEVSKKADSDLGADDKVDAEVGAVEVENEEAPKEQEAFLAQ